MSLAPSPPDPSASPEDGKPLPSRPDEGFKGPPQVPQSSTDAAAEAVVAGKTSRSTPAESLPSQHTPRQVTGGQPTGIGPPRDQSSSAQEAAPPSSHRTINRTAPMAVPGAGLEGSTSGTYTERADGRVKNPVPSKLQNQPSETEGNFAVMHMDRRQLAIERGLAAKRSSEATQAAALNAYKSGYQSLKRGRYVWKPASPEQTSNHAPPSTPRSADGYQQQGSYSMTPQNHTYQAPPGLEPAMVKTEQARLLTFLRGIHPVLVVDQLCKALAYFGGIPGAPPPLDPNGFPFSERGYGTGALIVGWLAEIFPPADMTKPPFSTFQAPTASGVSELPPQGIDQEPRRVSAGPPTAPTNGETPTRRPRGRPKGSKSTKVRKDKGMKKGQKAGSDGQDDSGAAPAQSANADATGHHDADSGSLSTPGQKKRGRPKGSKNRPKPLLVDLAQSQGGSAQSSLAVSQASPATNASGIRPAQATLSQHAQNWADPPAYSPSNGLGVADASRKGHADQQLQQRQRQLPADSQAAQPPVKRRRLSRDSQQTPTAPMGPHSSGPGASSEANSSQLGAQPNQQGFQPQPRQQQQQQQLQQHRPGAQAMNQGQQFAAHSQFSQSYGNNGMINMQYAMNAGRTGPPQQRQQQQQQQQQQGSPPTDFAGQPGPLLAETEMQDALYNAFSRR